MATGGDIVDSVLEIVQEPSFDDALVLAQLNKCAREISRKFILPALDAEGSVDTVLTGPSVALPIDYQRNLYHCQDGTARNAIDICNSKDQLSRYYDDRLNSSGPLVRGVAAVRPLLYYAPIPTVVTTLRLRYQKKPPEILRSTDLDKILPEGFDDLWENYALWHLYAMIEQGAEGQKTDTTYRMNIYLGMRDELGNALNEGVSMPPPCIARMERW